MFKRSEVLKQAELLGQQFSVYGTPQGPLFKAQDVAAMIEHSNITKMLDLVDDDEKGVNQLLTPGGNQQVWFLTENGLYEVLMQSRKPIAKQFKKGVKAILKEIRQTGGYLATTQDDTPEMIMARALQVAQVTIENHKQQLQIAQGTIEHQEKEIKHLAPKAQYTDEVLQSGQWMLTAKYQGNGYTNVRTHTFTHSDGRQGTNSITVWTEKGRKFLHDFQKRTSKLQGRKEVTL